MQEIFPSGVKRKGRGEMKLHPNPAPREKPDIAAIFPLILIHPGL
jgi:hypothetical protein